MSWYCDVAPGHPFHGPYHDEEYGFPLTAESGLFERLSLEVFQAGLSWEIVLKKRDGLRRAFADFDVDRVASFDEGDLARLMADPAIIRNRRKIEATIENARRIAGLRRTGEGFAAWIEAGHPMSKEEWVRRFRATFVFMGGEVVGEFLMSIGYLPGAHRDDCPVAQRIAACAPAWLRS